MSTHATHLTYSALSKVGRFSHKAKYARLRTPRGPRMGFRESFSFRPSVQPQVKVLPSVLLESGPRIRLRFDRPCFRPNLQPVADVCARQPFQRAIRPCGRHRARHIPSDEISVNYTTFRRSPSNRARKRPEKIAFAEHGENGGLEARSPFGSPRLRSSFASRALAAKLEGVHLTVSLNMP